MCMGDLKWLVHGIEVPTTKSKDTRKNQMLSLSNGRGMVWETEGSSDSTTGLARKGFNAQVELPMTCVWIEVFGKIETKEYDAPAFLIDLVPRCSTDFSFWIRIVPIIWYRMIGVNLLTCACNLYFRSKIVTEDEKSNDVPFQKTKYQTNGGTKRPAITWSEESNVVPPL
jgi:hypothetical protein